MTHHNTVADPREFTCFDDGGQDGFGRTDEEWEEIFEKAAQNAEKDENIPLENDGED